MAAPTDRCPLRRALAVQLIAEKEGVRRLRQPPGGSNTRWQYWIEAATWLDPVGPRYECILTILLHKWLVAQGSEGIVRSSMAPRTPGAPSLSDRDEERAEVEFLSWQDRSPQTALPPQ